MTVIDAFIQRTKQRRAKHQMHPRECTCSMCADIRADLDAQMQVMDARNRRSAEIALFIERLECPNIMSGPRGSSILDPEYQPRVRR